MDVEKNEGKVCVCVFSIYRILGLED
jgi:hypothetical protein